METTETICHWVPQPDITAYELALAMTTLLAWGVHARQGTLVLMTIEGLPENVRRHFTVSVSKQIRGREQEAS